MHWIHMKDAKIVVNIDHVTKCCVRVEVEIEKLRNTLNRDDRWKLSNTWKPIIQNIKKRTW